MSVSKSQKAGIEVRCNCGCDEIFKAFPVYSPNGEDMTLIHGPRGGKLYVPMYKRGHHPNCRKRQFGKTPAWNKGLKKGDHPSIANMGFQTQHGQPKIRIMETPEGRAFIKFIMERDGFKCTQCSSTTILQTHHKEKLRDAPHRALDPENVITLCAACHGRIHANETVKNRNSNSGT